MGDVLETHRSAEEIAETATMSELADALRRYGSEMLQIVVNALPEIPEEQTL